MPLINQIKSLQEQGLTEEQIIQNLQEQGLSPLEVNQAVEQAKIKSAVQETEQEEMQPSMTEPVGEYGEYPQETLESPMPIEEQAPLSQETPQYIYPTPQQAYPSYQEYSYSNQESVSEIAEQITEEKINQIKGEISGMTEFKTLSSKKIESMDERLKKIENIIERLQATIIGKIGSFSSNIQDIKEEMGMMQDSFSKALNPLIEKAKSAKKEVQENKEVKESRKPERKKSDGFEHYLRK